MAEVHKANRVVRSVMTKLEDDRVTADRHVLHLEALEDYQESTGKKALTQTDVIRFYETSNAEMQDNTGQSLTSQSLSFNGFSDKDSDYVP